MSAQEFLSSGTEISITFILDEIKNLTLLMYGFFGNSIYL
jgi:hypothetical protein